MFDPEKWNRWTFIVIYITMIATIGCFLLAIASYNNHTSSDTNADTNTVDHPNGLVISNSHIGEHAVIVGGNITNADIGSDVVVGDTNVVGNNNAIGDNNIILNSNTDGDNNTIGNTNKIYSTNTVGNNNTIGNNNTVGNNFPAPTNQSYYDDKAWLSIVNKYNEITSDDIRGISTSINNEDPSLLRDYSEHMLRVTIAALDEEKKLKLSPMYKSANDEWVAGLQDYLYSAKDFRLAAIYAMEGNDTTKSISDGVTYYKQGFKHLKNTNNLLNG